MVFHTAEINEKKNIIIMKKKKTKIFLGTEPKMGYCPFRQQAGRWALGVLALGAQAGRAGRACRARTASGRAWARGRGRRWALGRWGARSAGGRAGRALGAQGVRQAGLGSAQCAGVGVHNGRQARGQAAWARG